MREVLSQLHHLTRKQAETSTSVPRAHRVSRDQRINDNHALLYAMERAQKTKAPVALAFNLVRSPEGQKQKTHCNINEGGVRGENIRKVVCICL